MEHPIPLPEPLLAGSLPTALAPMQDVTDVAFMRVLGIYGVPDYFFTEYFRVHEHSTPEPHIIESIVDNGTSRPIFAQLIGEDLFHLERTARALLELPIAGIDLNMGCPAPKVYRKNVGGGLLREPAAVERIFATLRACCPGRFAVKMRLGFEDHRHYAEILELVNRHQVDVLSIHGRTVRQMYRGEVDYGRIRQACRTVHCPVFANGNITSAAKALEVRTLTGCHGVMMGRSAIRNPWIFAQTRDLSTGKAPCQPTLGDVRQYIDVLWNQVTNPSLMEVHRLNRMKKFLNFVGQGVDAGGCFLHAMRRARTARDFFAVCDAHLLDEGRASLLFAEEPFQGVVARPNHE